VAKIASLVLTKKQSPKKGTVCKPDVPVAQPSWWDAAVKNVGGTTINRELGNAYFGLDAADAFADYRAVVGSASVVFETVSRVLASNGYRLEKTKTSDPATDPQFFVGGNGSDYVGVFLSPPKELMKYKMYAPDGKVPQGTTLISMYFWPPSE
jgi:hypothetical protein